MSPNPQITTSVTSFGTAQARPAPWIRDALADAARTRLVNNIVGQLLNGVSEPVLLRAFEYLRNVDKGLGDRVEQGVRAAQP